jgi:hypothetical protein
VVQDQGQLGTRCRGQATTQGLAAIPAPTSQSGCRALVATEKGDQPVCRYDGDAEEMVPDAIGEGH